MEFLSKRFSPLLAKRRPWTHVHHSDSLAGILNAAPQEGIDECSLVPGVETGSAQAQVPDTLVHRAATGPGVSVD